MSEAVGQRAVDVQRVCVIRAQVSGAHEEGGKRRLPNCRSYSSCVPLVPASVASPAFCALAIPLRECLQF